jgi:hypothetical protein
MNLLFWFLLAFNVGSAFVHYRYQTTAKINWGSITLLLCFGWVIVPAGFVYRKIEDRKNKRRWRKRIK